MAALNKVMIIGNLGRDPEVRQAGDSPVADFSVAVTEKFRGRDGQQQGNDLMDSFHVVFLVNFMLLICVGTDILHDGGKCLAREVEPIAVLAGLRQVAVRSDKRFIAVQEAYAGILRDALDPRKAQS